MNGRWLASRSASQSKSRGSGDGGGEFRAAALSRRLNENRLARRLCYDALGCGSTSLFYGHSLRLIAGKFWLSLNSFCYQVSRFRRHKDFFFKRFLILFNDRLSSEGFVCSFYQKSFIITFNWINFLNDLTKITSLKLMINKLIFILIFKS